MKTLSLLAAGLLLTAAANAEVRPQPAIATVEADASQFTQIEHHKTASDIVDTAAAAGQFETLLAAATAAGLVDALKSEGPLTVFAPTDAAFSALPPGTVETLLKPENQHLLADVLKLHVISGKVKSTDLAGTTTTATTLNGELSIDGTSGVIVRAPGSTALVIKADIKASNGIIHVVDRVLLPAS